MGVRDFVWVAEGVVVPVTLALGETDAEGVID